MPGKPTMKPRDYQAKAVNAIFSYLATHAVGNPLVVAPTGSGKTHLLAYFCQRIQEQYANQKVLIVTHTKEIIQQDANTLQLYLGKENVGVFSAGLNKRQRRRFTVAGIQSIFRHARDFSDYSIIIVDEAHAIPPDGEGRYLTFFKGMTQARVIGLTATPFRLGHGYLTNGHMFDKVVYDIKITELLQAGYLCNVTSKLTGYNLNTDKLAVQGGDYAKKAMSQRFDKRDVTTKIVDELIAYKEQRKSWLIFAIDIEHAEHIANILNERGIISAAVHSKLDVDRQPILDLFKNGTVQALVSVETLTTGFDAPNVDMVVLMRPTQSPVLHVQMIGRGMRIAEGKQNCLVLDFAGNVRRLGPINDVQVYRKGQGRSQGERERAKACPKCHELISLSARTCPVCGYRYPLKLMDAPDTGDIVAKRKKSVEDFEVIRLSTFKHFFQGSTDACIRVTYHCTGGNIFREYITRKGLNRWWGRLGQDETPYTIEAALARSHEIKTPKRIRVSYLSKYPKVIGKYRD